MRFPDYLSLSLRSLRRSRVRSLLTIFAIVIGATGITVMLTFVTSVKNLTVASFVKTGEIKQIQVSRATDMQYDPTGMSGGNNNSLKTASASTTTPLTPSLEAKIAALPHVTAVAGMFRIYREPVISNINYNGKNWVAQNVIGYQPTGAFMPLLLAGRDLIGSDTGNQVLISQSYADVMGFSGRYDKIIGIKINLHTIQGYTGAGVNLPSQLPRMIQCKPTQQGNQQHCFGGPTSGMPAINIPATIVGVLDNPDPHPVLMMPLNPFIRIYNQAIPSRANFPSQQRQHQNCKPGTPCPPGNGNGGGNGENQMPSGPGVVGGGWNRPTDSAFITASGGIDSFMAEADDLTNVAEVATAIGRFGVGTTTGLKALNDQKAQANIIGLILGALGLIALLIASLGVMNTMIMSVLQRTREIGVMRALGARRRTIRRIFTIEATTIGFFGGLIGVTFGSIFVLVAKPVITKMAKSGSLTGATFAVPHG
jgi:ABC-type antimicrobial peptide transport system permease subunit